MPDFFTHILCAEDILENIEDEEIKKEVKNKIKLYYLGAQGPDIFYYNNIFNKEEKKKLNSIGDNLHKYKTKEFFEESFKYLKNKLDQGEEYENLLVYLLGFLTHFSLDTNAHPYIYHLTGFYDKNIKETKVYNSYHKKLEIIIDVLMMNIKKKLPAYKRRAYMLIDNGKSLSPEIENYYKYILEKVYGEDIDKKSIGNNYIFMKKYQKLLFDPRNIKKYFVLFGIKLLKSTKYYFYTFYPNKVEGIDYLNFSKKKWRHPVTGEENTTSFINLFEEGKEDGLNYINSYIRYLKGNNEEIKDIIPNISYLTGLPCEDDRCMNYFHIIF